MPATLYCAFTDTRYWLRQCSPMTSNAGRRCTSLIESSPLAELAGELISAQRATLLAEMTTAKKPRQMARGPDDPANHIPARPKPVSCGWTYNAS